MLIFFLYHTFVKLSSSEDSSSEEICDIIGYASEVIKILPNSKISEIDNDLVVNYILGDWLVSRAYDLDKICKEKNCDFLVILNMLEKRSYERLEELESNITLDYSKMTDSSLELHMKSCIEFIENFDNKSKDVDGYTNLLPKKKEIYDIFVWNVSKLDTCTKKLDEVLYAKNLFVLGEYANLLTIRIIRKNIEYIKSKKCHFEYLKLPVEN